MMAGSSNGFKGSLPPIDPGSPHVPCVLLVDISGSMNGLPLEELKEGLRIFGETIKEDEMAVTRADICVFAFNSSVNEVVPFVPAKEFWVPSLNSSGMTAMNQAILCGIEAIKARKREYARHGIPYYRPWLFLLTDGQANDDSYEVQAKTELSNMINNKKLSFFPMGIGNHVDYKMLESYCSGNGHYFKASRENFKNTFLWLSNSLSAISNSSPGESVNLPPTPQEITIITVPSK